MTFFLITNLHKMQVKYVNELNAVKIIRIRKIFSFFFLTESPEEFHEQQKCYHFLGDDNDQPCIRQIIASA